MNNNDYSRLADIKTKNSPCFKNCVFAFLIGGGICLIGQLMMNMFRFLCRMDEQVASGAVCVTLIFLSAVLTGTGLYQKLARIAGAGTLVPITGFANAVVSPALEYKSEGGITGTGVKLFTIAGPVIVYGTAASVIYGLIYFICGTVFGL